MPDEAEGAAGMFRKRDRVRVTASSAAAALCATVVPVVACAQAQPNGAREPAPAVRGAPVESPDTVGSIEVLDDLMAERMRGLARDSRTWRAAMDTLRGTGFRVVIGSPADVRQGVDGLADHHARHFGEVVPLRDDAGEIIGAAVVIDVARVRRLAERGGLSDAVVARDVDRILIHEVYGHVVPLSQTRRISGGCPDPRVGEPPWSSCAIRRENRIRAELGLEPRTAYDITGLAVGRYLRAERGAAPARNRDGG